MDAAKVISLSKKYIGETETIDALDNINLSIKEGEFVAVVGTSGSGKTTLLNMLGGLDEPSEGSVIIDGVTLEALDEEERTEFRRRKIGFVFQKLNLIPVINVYENIVLPAKLNKDEPDEKMVRELADILGIRKKLLEMPNALSGGQRQRVAIARALYTKPCLILADEPTGNLDAKTTDDVMRLLKEMSDRYNRAMVVVTHDERVASLADRVIRIEDGRVVSR